MSGSGAGLDPGEDTEEDADQLISQFKIPNDLKYQSRLSSEFRVLKYLGSGSFGKVLKVMIMHKGVGESLQKKGTSCFENWNRSTDV